MNRKSNFTFSCDIRHRIIYAVCDNCILVLYTYFLMINVKKFMKMNYINKQSAITQEHNNCILSFVSSFNFDARK